MIYSRFRYFRFVLGVIGFLIQTTLFSQWQFTSHQKITKDYDFGGLQSLHFSNGDFLISGNVIDTIELTSKVKIYPAANETVFFARITSNDSVIWYKTFSNSSSTGKLAVKKIAIHPATQNVYLAGEFTGSVNFGGGISKSAGTLADVFWMKTNSAGGQIKVGQYSDGLLSTLSVGTGGEVCIGGRNMMTGNHAYVAKFDTTGSLKSSNNKEFMGTTSNRDIVNSVVYGDDGSIYFAGKCNGDSMGLGKFIDGPNDINRYNLFYGKFNANMGLEYLMASKPLPGNRPYQFDLNNAHFQKDLNRVVFTGTFDGSNYIVDNDTLALTSLVNTDARKPIILCFDTAMNLEWQHSLGMISENQRGGILQSTKWGNDIWLAADIEHYLYKDFYIGNVKFYWGGKAFLLICLDSMGQIKSSFGTKPELKTKVNWVHNLSGHNELGLIMSMVNSVEDTLLLPSQMIFKGSYLVQAFNCNVNAEITNSPFKLCENADEFTITAFPFGGYFEGSNISNDGKIDPKLGKLGTQYFSYIYEDANGCIVKVKDSIIVKPKPVVSISGLDTAYCPKDTIVLAKGFPLGGAFYGDLASNGSFNPLTKGTGTFLGIYKYKNNDGCENSDTLQYRVKKSSECFSGVNDLGDVTFKFYPNPSNGNFIVENHSNGCQQFYICNFLGEVVFHSTLEIGLNRIDYFSAKPGIYFLQIGIGKIEKIIIE